MGEEIPTEPPVIDPNEDYVVYVDAWDAGVGLYYVCEGTYLGTFSDTVAGWKLIEFLNEPAADPPSIHSTNRQCNVYHAIINIAGHVYSKQRVIAIVLVV